MVYATIYGTAEAGTGKQTEPPPIGLHGAEMPADLTGVAIRIDITNGAAERPATGTNFLLVAKESALLTVKLGAVGIILAAHGADTESRA